MVGFSTTEAIIKSKHVRREELILREKNTCFWQRSLTAKQLLHGAKGRKTANTHPESAFGWVLIGWALGLSLIIPLQEQDAKDHFAFLLVTVGPRQKKPPLEFWV